MQGSHVRRLADALLTACTLQTADRSAALKERMQLGVLRRTMTGLLTRRAKQGKQTARDEAHRASRGVSLAMQEPVAVDGLRFRRGGDRFRVQGVTYGPFAPSENGVQFPARETVRRD